MYFSQNILVTIYWKHSWTPPYYFQPALAYLYFRKEGTTRLFVFISCLSSFGAKPICINFSARRWKKMADPGSYDGHQIITIIKPLK